jgi:hypothetical protein
MSQSNRLKILHSILNQAVENGNPNDMTGIVLLQTMKLELQPRNLLIFFEVLANAREEILRLEKDDSSLYLPIIEKLQSIFTENYLWNGGLPWANCLSFINSQQFLPLLRLLADKLHYQNPDVILKQNFIYDTKSYLETLILEVDRSELSNKLKKYIKQKVRDILRAIERYDITGSDAIRKATDSFVSEFSLIENSFSDKDKKNPTLKNVKSTIASLFFAFITPTIFDLVGVVPEIHQYWMPQIQRQINDYSGEFTLQELINNMVDNFKKESPNLLSGRDQKALPPYREDSETEKENDNSEGNLE